MTKRVIQSNEDYEAALAEVEKLMDGDPEPGTPQADKLESLVKVVQDYERKHFND